MINRDTVINSARLARITLSDEEISKFEKDLSGILAFVEKLNEVDTSRIDPLTGGSDLENVVREDATSEQETMSNEQVEKLIGAAPKKRDGYVEVQSVFER